MADLPLPDDAITAAVDFMHTRFPKWEPGDKGVGFPWTVFVDALAVAAPVIAAAEREHIRQLAIEAGAFWICYSHTETLDGTTRLGKSHPFADLLGAETPPQSSHDDPEPVCEAGHHEVDWDRLHRLRQARAIEPDEPLLLGDDDDG